MAKNYLLTYAEQLATYVELLCQNIKAPSNTLFQIRIINEETFKSHRNLCGRIRRMLIASCKTLKENTK